MLGHFDHPFGVAEVKGQFFYSVELSFMQHKGSFIPGVRVNFIFYSMGSYISGLSQIIVFGDCAFVVSPSCV